MAKQSKPEQPKMQARDFCYWLQGYFEVSGAKELNEEQTEIVKNHLALAFYHDIDNQYGNDTKSQSIHDGSLKGPLGQKVVPGKTLMRC